jgi:hypothetical protein
MINDLKELEGFLKLCRKQGISEITFHGTTVKFGEFPSKPKAKSSEEVEIPTEELSPDELIYYAVENAGPV